MKIDRIKTRDKRCEGEERVKYQRKNHCANVHLFGHYLLLHQDRVEYHAQRVAGEEMIMRRHGINPHQAGSAVKFDRLIGEVK